MICPLAVQGSGKIGDTGHNPDSLGAGHRGGPLMDRRLMEEYSCQAIYLDDDITGHHYSSFSN